MNIILYEPLEMTLETDGATDLDASDLLGRHPVASIHSEIRR